MASLPVFSNTDLSFSSAFRSYPAPGIEAGLEVGKGLYLWDNSSSKPFLFGFIRPKLRAMTSVVVNNATAAIEIFPISILGFEFGYQYIKSDYDGFTFYNCDEVRCRGEIHRQYAAMRGALGYKKIMGTYSVKVNRNSYNNANSKDVAEFRTANLIDQESEVSYETRYVLGYKLESGMIGVLTEYHKFSETKAFNQMNLLIYAQKSQKSTVVYGLGGFESSHVAKGLIFVLQFKYDFMKKIGLF
jgi:hypothetical protein